MKKVFIVVGLLGMFLIQQCTTNPMTGRKQLSIVSNSELMPAAFTQYSQVLKESKVVVGTAEANMVKTVGARIKMAAENYYKSIGRESQLNGYQWEFNLIEDKQLNAWCMPGGKVAFYTGIMPICKTDGGVAVVMGHEVAHALANHSSERASAASLAQLGAVVGQVGIQNNSYRSIFSAMYPVGAQLSILKYSRKHESEADEMGLYFMAMAGYDPKEAPKFWERMSAGTKGSSQPGFLSTHPSSENRISDLNAKMPKALTYYKK